MHGNEPIAEWRTLRVGGIGVGSMHGCEKWHEQCHADDIRGNSGAGCSHRRSLPFRVGADARRHSCPSGNRDDACTPIFVARV
jgi:hypothetical protein